MVDSFKTRITRIYNRMMQKSANVLFLSILKTPPLRTRPDAETVFYCALDKTACRQFIAMAKSFLRFTNEVHVVIQDDGTLTEEQIREIKSHIVGVTIYRKDDMFKLIRSEAEQELLCLIPGEEDYYIHKSVKIMYLKFLNVIFRFNGRKVIIVDSDLLFVRRPDEIIAWIAEPYRYDFYGEGSNAKADEFYDMGFRFDSLDIANFSSGTIGIGGEVSNQRLVEIFDRINKYDRSLFYEWEIEQALWAVVMAQRPGALNLDELRKIYIGSGWRPYIELRDKAIIAHFAGAIRFNRLKYLRLLRLIVKELQKTLRTISG